MSVTRKIILTVALIIGLVIWVIGIFHFRALVKADERDIAAFEQARQREEERLRRLATYEKNRMEQQLNRGTTTNPVHRLKQ